MCSVSFYSAVSFATQSKEIRQTVLKERIKAAQDQQDLRRRLIRNPATDELGRQYYRVPVGSNIISICINGFKNLFGIFRTQWEYLRKSCADNYVPGPIPHGNLGTRHRKRSSAVVPAAPSFTEFLQKVCDTYAEPYATRFIREITGMSLREAEEGTVQLPSSFTKQKLYAEYCYSRGYKIKSDANGSYGD